MTENKRFEIIKTKTYGLYVPVDKMEFYNFSSFESEFDCIRVVNALNDLEEKSRENGKIASKYLEENEQLKKELFEARKDYILETYADNPIRRDERLKALEKELQEMIEITPMSWQKCAFQVYKYQRLYCQLKQKWCNSKDCKEQMI